MTGKIIKYAPGGNWLYLKCYGGPQTLEEWLVSRLRPCIKGWQAEGLFHLFHFVRFLDPEYHIRLRFKLSDPSYVSVILPEINRSISDLMELELVWKLEVSTYEPEIERYGAERMEFAEQFFSSDSDFWIEILAQNGLDETEPVWKIVVVSVDRLLSDFKAGTQEKYNILERLRNSLTKEFGLGRSFKAQLDEKYRKMQAELSLILSTGHNWWDTELSRRTQACREPVIRISETFPNRESLFESPVIPDLIHMSLNRAFRTRHRLQELVIYDFMVRHYQSVVARSKG